MEPILDETSLVPCTSWPLNVRLRTLAKTLQALDDLGAPRILRSVRDAVDRDVDSGKGLRTWCFHPSVDRNAGRLIFSHLDKQPPFIDGDDGLFSTAEGYRAIEARALGVTVFGLGLAALNGSFTVALEREASQASSRISVDLTYLGAEEDRSESIGVLCLVNPLGVQENCSSILEMIDGIIRNGRYLMERASEKFPRLRFGPRAIEQIGDLTGTEPMFRQLVRHLRALDLGARGWLPDTAFAPSLGLTWSQESKATLNDGKFGPLRDFPMPDGFAPERWNFHTKPTGGAEVRLYFIPKRTNGGALVLIGYFGDHLPTQKYRT